MKIEYILKEFKNISKNNNIHYSTEQTLIGFIKIALEQYARERVIEVLEELYDIGKDAWCFRYLIPKGE